MQIRTLFFTGMFAVAAMAACLGGWTLTWAMEEYRLAGRMERAVDISALLFAVGDRLVEERPVAADALLAAAQADPPRLAMIAHARRDTDQAIAAAEARIRAVSSAGAPGQLDTLAALRAALEVWRGKADRMLVLSKSLRDPGYFGAFLTDMTAMADSLDPAMAISDFAALRHDGVTMDLTYLNRQLWSIRELTGPRITALMTAIESETALSPAQILEQHWLDGRLTERWAVADALAARLANVPDIADSLAAPLAAARQAFDAQDRVHKALLEEARQGGPYSSSAFDIGRLSVNTRLAFSRGRDAALLAARTRVEQNQRAAAVKVALAGGSVLLIIALTLTVLIVLCRRIVSPVLALTRAIDRLAQRDYAVEIPSKASRDEIGRMAAAVETLRREAIAAADAEDWARHVARHDTLTGLANRTLLQERMQHAVSLAVRGRTCAALSVDLDRFKSINDTYGHPVGDRLLQSVADRLTACVRETDTVSRFGADEFVVLLIDLDDADAAGRLAQRIVRAVSAPHEFDGEIVSVGVSVGIAIAPQDATTATGLLRSAATALDRAKQDEPGSYRFFEQEMDARLQARLTLERDLREAVRTGRFDVMYQPQYNLAENRLCGFEALVRWHHPVRGVVGPDEFIPVAEETGLIVPIGAWVLQQACAEAMNWPDTVKVAVNLSAVQFRNHPLTDTVRQALCSSGLPACRLDLEITESLLLGNSAAVLATLHELRDMGARISMDDFGTGYSSLSYLRSFPFDKIKIDQSFVRDLSTREDSQAIIRAVVAMGDSLGMTTTAEGVETADQLACLRREGCTEVQGYLFSAPVTADAARRLANNQCVAAMAET